MSTLGYWCDDFEFVLCGVCRLGFVSVGFDVENMEPLMYEILFLIKLKISLELLKNSKIRTRVIIKIKISPQNA